jgi:hypothetical protein
MVAGEGLSEDIIRELARDPKLASPHTQKSYRLDLVRFEAWRAGRLLTKLLVEQYVAELQTESLSPTTINRRLSAVRWWARRVADMAIEDVSMDRAMRDELVLQAVRVAAIDNVKGRHNAKGRHLSEGELAALMRACDAAGATTSPTGSAASRRPYIETSVAVMPVLPTVGVSRVSERSGATSAATWC